MKKLKTMIAAAGAFCLMALPSMVVAQTVLAEDLNLPGQVTCGTEFEQNTGGQGCTPSSSGKNLVDVITDVINIFSWIVGAVSVIMIIYGGFRYITSAGNDANVTSAKNTILYAIIGLVIVALAQVIVRFVMTQFTNE
jgi:hypothetical protein